MSAIFKKYYDILQGLDFDACLNVQKKIQESSISDRIAPGYNPFVYDIFFKDKSLEEFAEARSLVEKYRSEGKEILYVTSSRNNLRGDILVGVSFPKPLEKDLHLNLTFSERKVSYEIPAGSENFVFRNPALIGIFWKITNESPVEEQEILWWVAHLSDDDRRTILSTVNMETSGI